MRGLEDLRAIVVEPAREGRAAATVGDVATVRLGEATRNGAVSRDGQGEAVEGWCWPARRGCAQPGRGRAGQARRAGAAPAPEHEHPGVLQPRRAGLARGRHRGARAGRGQPARGGHAVPVPGRRACRSGGGGHAAAVHAGHLLAHALCGPDRQSDEPGWPGHRAGHAGRCLGGGGGKHRDRAGAQARRRNAGTARRPSGPDPGCRLRRIRAHAGRVSIIAIVFLPLLTLQGLEGSCSPRGTDHSLGPGGFGTDSLHRGSGAGLAAAARSCQRRSLADAQAGPRLCTPAALEPRAPTPGVRHRGGGAGGSGRPVSVRGQDLYAHHGRGRSHRAVAEGAVRLAGRLAGHGPARSRRC